MVTPLYKTKNRYYSRSQVTEVNLDRSFAFFALDLTGSNTVKFTHILYG